LTAIAGGPAEAAANETGERVEHAPNIRTHDHRGPERNLSRPRRGCLFERPLPRARDVNAEAPRPRRVRLVAAEHARALVVVSIVGVPVDRRGAGLQPRARRSRRSRKGSADGPSRLDTRLQDLSTATRRIAAIDAAACKIDHRVGVLELSLPWARTNAIPRDDAPWTRERVATEHDHLVASGVKGTRKNRPDLT
jgi:hypothetical protein